MLKKLCIKFVFQGNYETALNYFKVLEEELKRHIKDAEISNNAKLSRQWKQAQRKLFLERYEVKSIVDALEIFKKLPSKEPPGRPSDHFGVHK